MKELQDCLQNYMSPTQVEFTLSDKLVGTVHEPSSACGDEEFITEAENITWKLCYARHHRQIVAVSGLPPNAYHNLLAAALPVDEDGLCLT